VVQRINTPADPRLAPLLALRRVMPFVMDDSEAKAERRLLHRADLRTRVR